MDPFRTEYDSKRATIEKNLGRTKDDNGYVTGSCYPNPSIDTLAYDVEFFLWRDQRVLG